MFQGRYKAVIIRKPTIRSIFVGIDRVLNPVNMDMAKKRLLTSLR